MNTRGQNSAKGPDSQLTRWAPYFCALFAFGFLSPILAGGLYWDDSVLSGYAGIVEASGLSLPEKLARDILGWATTHGRLFPVGLIAVEVTSYFCGGIAPIWAKLVQVSLIVATLVVVGRLFASLSRCDALGALFLLICPLCLQLRPWHDPLTSFIPLIPLVSLLVFSQALLLNSYLQGGGALMLASSVGLFAISLLTYELAVIAPLLNAVVLLRCRPPITRIIRVGTPYAVVFALYVAACFLMRSTHTYSGITLASFDGSGRALLIHIVGAIPLSYWLFDPKNIFNGDWFQSVDLYLVGILGACLTAVILVLWRPIARAIQSPAFGPPLVLGTTIWISSSALMASSARYRIDVADFGMAYTASFIGAIGVGIIVTCGTAYCITRLQLHPLSSTKILAVGVIMAIVPFFVLREMVTVLRWQEALFGTTKQSAFNKAAKTGLFSAIRDGSVVCEASDALYWLSPAYVRMLTDKRVEVNTTPCKTRTTPTVDVGFETIGSDWLNRPQYKVTAHTKPAEFAPLKIGEVIDFAQQGNKQNFLGEGWPGGSDPLFTWTNGPISSLSMMLPEDSPPVLCVDAVVYPYLHPPMIKSRVITISVNGGAPQFRVLDRPEWSLLSFMILTESSRQLTIVFTQPESPSPEELGLSDDPRHLGIALKTMVARNCS